MTRSERRDLFAAAALQGIISRGPGDIRSIADAARDYADALIAELDESAVDEASAEAEELAAINRQLCDNAVEAEQERKTLVGSLRGMVAAADACLDPLWSERDAALAKIKAELAWAREVLSHHTDDDAAATQPVGEHEARASEQGDSPLADAGTGRPPRKGAPS